MALVVRLLAPTLHECEKLITEIDKGVGVAFPAQLEIEEAAVERKRLLDITHFQGDVIKL